LGAWQTGENTDYRKRKVGKSMGFRYDTFCGLYCGACDVLQANKSGTIETLAQAWGEEPEQLRCRGCKSEINAVYCKECGIKLCAKNKEVEYCFQCDDYPCTRLVAFRNDDHAHHSIVLRNLDHIGRHGLEQWLEEQRARWSCPNCGVGFTWYDKVCKGCGNGVYNCKDEESDIVDERTGNG
jgi:hypothetical protein